MKIDLLLEELKNLNLPEDEFVIIGSGSLAVRRWREANDLDVLVSEKLWASLKEKFEVYVKGKYEYAEVGNIEIVGKGSFYHKPNIATVQQLIDSADVISGIRYINLELLKKFKKKIGREKDLKDIELIDKYLTQRRLKAEV